MKVGGRDFHQTKRDVEQAMRGEVPEDIRKYLVEVNGRSYPPKQVLARVTGWERQSFTTMEAQRVLNKLGFQCREATQLDDGREAWLPYDGKPASPLDIIPGTVRARAAEDRIDVLENELRATNLALATAQEAIAGLGYRVRALEESS